MDSPQAIIDALKILATAGGCALVYWLARIAILQRPGLAHPPPKAYSLCCAAAALVAVLVAASYGTHLQPCPSDVEGNCIERIVDAHITLGQKADYALLVFLVAVIPALMGAYSAIGTVRTETDDADRQRPWNPRTPQTRLTVVQGRVSHKATKKEE